MATQNKRSKRQSNPNVSLTACIFVNTESDTDASNDAAPSKHGVLFADLPAQERNSVFAASLRERQQYLDSQWRKTTTPSDETAVRSAPQPLDETVNERKRKAAPARVKFLEVQCSPHDNVATATEAVISDAAATLRAHGLVVLRQCVESAVLQSLVTISNGLRQRIQVALQARALTDEDCFRFAETASRCRGRIDAKHNISMDTKETSFWLHHPILNGVVNLALDGGDSGYDGTTAPQLLYAGWIWNLPGSDDQPWHQDGIPLFPGPVSKALPAYALNVFIPLQDADGDVVAGATEFVPASHHVEPPDAMKMVYQQDGTVMPRLRAGDVLMYDYRVCHRGTANQSPSVRSILYLMYARPWFHEHMNFGTDKLLA